MKISKELAIEKATSFARAEGIKTPIVEVLFVRGRSVDGSYVPAEDEWAVHFDRDLASNIVMDPATAIVVVNATTGEVSMPPSL